MSKKVVLAYSGGLDTSVAIKWIKERYGMEVVTLTVDLGASRDLSGIKERALGLGACKAVVIDAREVFVRYFVLPALQAGALYEGVYPLATALGRPLIAKLLAEVAEEEGAEAVAHGCTGKGNDQVRFELTLQALAPQLQVIAPVREWDMSREEAIEYAQTHGIPVEARKQSPYSIDENVWGRSIECGALEDPWAEPPEDVWQWTGFVKDCPDEPAIVEIGIEKGVPFRLDKDYMDALHIIEKLNKLGGLHGVGRIDHVESRVVGIKSREVYEAPAAVILHKAHRALEGLVMTREAMRFRDIVASQYADIIYNGQWFSAFHFDLVAYVLSAQRLVTGTVKMQLLKGTATVVGRRSPLSLYKHELATYEKGDEFDQKAAEGFIKIHGLPLKTQSKAQSQIIYGTHEIDLACVLPPRLKELTEDKKSCLE
ncbi:MAG: argininosuccinate synthase [Candidatus Brocadiales bacterium]